MSLEWDKPTQNGCQCNECLLRYAREMKGHDSDCAVHNEPAYPKGECDCSQKKGMMQRYGFKPSDDGKFSKFQPWDEGDFCLYIEALAEIYSISNGYIAEIEKLKSEVERLSKYQAVCHCGILCKDHGYQDGHSAVPMVETCPYAEDMTKLKDDLAESQERVRELEGELEIANTLKQGIIRGYQEIVDRLGLRNKELTEACKTALRIAESWIHDQLDGTHGLKDALKELEPIKKALEEKE